MKNKLVILGAGGHCKVVADIAKLCDYNEIVLLDDNEQIKSCIGYPVVGKTNETYKFNGCDFFVAIGNPEKREKIQNKIVQQGLNLITLIHPKAVIAQNVHIGTGTVIMAGAVINSESRIGNGCIINTGATVDHDNIIDDYVHISVGSHLAGCVHIGKNTWIGAGAILINNIDVYSDCMIGAGAVVVKNIYEAGTFVGIPAKKIK